MKIWQVEVRTEECSSSMKALTGVAENAQEAVDKAMKIIRNETAYEKPYVSRVTDLGEQDF